MHGVSLALASAIQWPDVLCFVDDRADYGEVRAADPDTVEITAELAAKLQPLRRRGRPPVQQPKAPITTRIDADVLHAIKDSGKGWQTRLNEMLREAVQQGKFKAMG